ncbi:MAG: DUF1302 domain-containing protein [Gemmatimonadota bacterium]|nr:DUF1302 domain-containing protein [Gemmatimonadota bacterium]
MLNNIRQDDSQENMNDLDPRSNCKPASGSPCKALVEPRTKRGKWCSKLICSVATISTIALATIGVANAFQFETSDPDLTITWDNLIRYNSGVRLQKQNPIIANSPNFDESDREFGHGQFVTNRLDLLSEFQFDWRKQLGFRVSGAAWYDAAFHNNVNTAPQLAAVGSYDNNQYSSFTKRWYKGPSGEILDAYGYYNFTAGDTSGNVKVGRQGFLWGEAIILAAQSISYAQTPSDFRKAAATPGATAKEIALPLAKVSGQLQVNPQLSFSAEWAFEWQPNRIPEGGTYLGSADFLFFGPDRLCISPVLCLRNKGKVNPTSTGDYGVAAAWRPPQLDTTLGFFARNYTEKAGWLKVSVPARSYVQSYAENVNLFGVSAATQVGGVSLGAEASYRRNAAFPSSTTDANLQGARGDSFHSLVNGVASFGKTPLWDSAFLTGELAYSRWLTTRSNAALYTSCQNAPPNQQDASYGCITKQAWQAALVFAPAYIAVLPGLDITPSATIIYGLRGNFAVLGPGSQNAGSFSTGVTFDYNQQYQARLAYNGYLAHYHTNGTVVTGSNGSQLQDRGWLSLTLQMNF